MLIACSRGRRAGCAGGGPGAGLGLPAGPQPGRNDDPACRGDQGQRPARGARLIWASRRTTPSVSATLRTTTACSTCARSAWRWPTRSTPFGPTPMCPRPPDGQGVAELLRGPLLAGRTHVHPRRWQITLGLDDGGEAVTIRHRRSMWPSAVARRGKSYLAGLICEQLVGLGYSLVVFDPEGDHVGLGELRGVLVTGGDDRRLADPAEVMRLLRHRYATVVVDLSHLDADGTSRLRDGPAGRDRGPASRHRPPQWVVVDEAHGPLGPGRRALGVFDPSAKGYLLVTWQPAGAVGRRPGRPRCGDRPGLASSRRPAGRSHGRGRGHAPGRDRPAARRADRPSRAGLAAAARPGGPVHPRARCHPPSAPRAQVRPRPASSRPSGSISGPNPTARPGRSPPTWANWKPSLSAATGACSATTAPATTSPVGSLASSTTNHSPPSWPPPKPASRPPAPRGDRRAGAPNAPRRAATPEPAQDSGQDRRSLNLTPAQLLLPGRRRTLFQGAAIITCRRLHVPLRDDRHRDHRTTRRRATESESGPPRHRAAPGSDRPLHVRHRAVPLRFGAESRNANQHQRHTLLRNSTQHNAHGAASAAYPITQRRCPTSLCSADRSEIAAADFAGTSTGSDPALQLHRTHLRRDPPAGSRSSATSPASTPCVSLAASCWQCLDSLGRLASGSPSPPPRAPAGLQPTCATLHDHQPPPPPTDYPATTPKTAIAPTEFRRDRITSPRQKIGRYISATYTRKWTATSITLASR